MGLATRDVLEAPAPYGTSTAILPGLSAGTAPLWIRTISCTGPGELGYHPQVLLAGRAINDSMPAHVAGMMVRGLNEVGKVIKESKVLIMGLAYKENVPDTRESPARGIVGGGSRRNGLRNIRGNT